MSGATFGRIDILNTSVKLASIQLEAGLFKWDKVNWRIVRGGKLDTALGLSIFKF